MANSVQILGLDDVGQFNTPIDDLETENVNLIFVGVDVSGSMQQFIKEMQVSLGDFKGALKNSKETDQLLVAKAEFNNNINVGGYKKIDDFDTSYNADGGTALYDVIVEGKDRLVQYLDHLKSNGMRVKAVFSIFSDGEDTSSVVDFGKARNAVDVLNKLEVTTAFICFGGIATNTATGLGFKNVLNAGGSASDLRKAFNTLSKSVISASKSVTPKTNNFFVV